MQPQTDSSQYHTCKCSKPNMYGIANNSQPVHSMRKKLKTDLLIRVATSVGRAEPCFGGWRCCVQRGGHGHLQHQRSSRISNVSEAGIHGIYKIVMQWYLRFKARADVDLIDLHEWLV